jgi:hypothetical protein
MLVLSTLLLVGLGFISCWEYRKKAPFSCLMMLVMFEYIETGFAEGGTDFPFLGAWRPTEINSNNCVMNTSPLYFSTKCCLSSTQDLLPHAIGCHQLLTW